MFKKIVVFCLTICSLFFIACGNEGNLGGGESGENIFYFDNKNIVIEDVLLEINYTENKLDNNHLNLTLKAKNTDTNDVIFCVEEVAIVNVLSEVVYDPVGENNITLTLKYNVNSSSCFLFFLPSSIEEDNYYLKFKLFGEEYIINLFETPDELRNDCEIILKIQNYSGGQTTYQTVHTLTVKEGRKCLEEYVFEEDNNYYCDTWYIDEGRTQKFSWGQTIEEDMVLYGIKLSNVKTTYESGQLWITGINYVSASGKLVIPNHNQKVYISNLAIKDNNKIVEIYFPKNLKRVYVGNFTGMINLKKIYFAGTQEEWNAIEKNSTIPSGVQIIFNTEYN